MADDFNSIDDELLDPCCRKEIDVRRREHNLSERLKASDRSNLKLDVQKNVLRSKLSLQAPTCATCCSCFDYDALKYLKFEISNKELSISEKVNIAENDDDDFDDIDPDFDSVYESAMRSLVKSAAEKLEFAKKCGYAIHSEESPRHLKQMVDEGTNVVCHLYDPSSLLSARLDLALETIATSYLGTKFRRINVLNTELNYLKEWLNKPVDLSSDCLLCFTGGELTTYTKDMHVFGYDDVVYSEEILRYLHHAHLLHSELLPINLSPQKEIIEDEKPLESFCNRKGCGRLFFHTHIDEDSKSKLIPLASEMDGADALPSNYFCKF